MKKQNKLLTVTIGTLAYNEEKSIGKMLQSVLEQKTKGFSIEKIIVISDGSTDKSAKIAKKIKDSRIQVIDGKENKGRVTRRNQIMKMSKTDILVFLDSDGVLENMNSLSALIAPFISNKKVSLVGGNAISIGNNKFLMKTLSLPQRIYTNVRFNINKGNNVFGCVGAIMAMRKNLYQTIKIPNDIFADDTFIYFTCLKNGYEFVNSRDSRTIHHFPSNISIYFKRRHRHEKSASEITKYFDSTLVNKEFFIPRKLLLEAATKTFVRHPLEMTFMSALIFYDRIKLTIW